MANESSSFKLTYLLVGLGIGAAVGILFAPKTGEETRDLIVGKTRDGAQWVTDRSNELSKAVQGVAKDAGRKIDRLAKASNGLADRIGLS
ncbi:MAG TPA: YtxH domain-containing protein [Terriglobia bacterium]|nr:YtxH domain-containing protein [Terriglobia bacterium]